MRLTNWINSLRNSQLRRNRRFGASKRRRQTYSSAHVTELLEDRTLLTPQAFFSPTTAQVTEGDSSTSPFFFIVTLSEPAGASGVYVDWRTNSVAGGATPGSDYSPVSFAQVYIPPGQTGAGGNVPIVGDTSAESTENFQIELTGATNATVGANNILTVSILDNDAAPPAVSVSVSPSSVQEDGTTNLVYTFNRGSAAPGSLSVNFSVGGAAGFNSDYTQSGASSYSSSAGSVTFSPNAQYASVTIDPTADTVPEASEDVVLTVVSGSGYTVGQPASAQGLINNDDTPTLSISAPTPSSVNEGNSGPTAVPFTVSLSGPPGPA